MEHPDRFDPYHTWLAIPPEEQPPNLYRLLGVRPFESKLEAIEHAADQRMAHLRALQTGKHGVLSQQILNQVAAARVCLLNAQKRAAYDAELHRKMAEAGPPPLPPSEPLDDIDGTLFDGKDLGTMLREIGPLPVAHAVNYVMQAASGLGHAHAHGVYHRNVKPTNLVVDRQGLVKVVGFGLARIEGGPLLGEENPPAELTIPGYVLGTRQYMTPEQVLSSAGADHRSDIYGLGCTLHTLLIGRPPHVGKSRSEKAVSPLKAPIPSLIEQRPDVPPSVEGVFRRMLAKRREERPQSMAEVIHALGSG